MQIIDNIPEFGTDVDAGALKQIKTCAQTATKPALMADHHRGYAVPIGGVVAYTDAISPSGVGFDVARGNKRCGSMKRLPLWSLYGSTIRILYTLKPLGVATPDQSVNANNHYAGHAPATIQQFRVLRCVKGLPELREPQSQQRAATLFDM